MSPVRSVDVARLAGVSRTTVSYVLNGRTDVSIPDETRQRVLDAARELNYRPNLAARSLVMGRSGLVSIWLQESSSIRHQADVIQTLQPKLFTAGTESLIHRFSTDDSSSRSNFDWQVDGILGYNLGQDHERIPVTIPSVSFGSYHYSKVDFVRVDLKTGVKTAMEHLISSGRKKIAYLVNQWGNHVGDDRFDGYTESVQSAGLETQYIVADIATMQKGRKAVLHALERGAKFDSLMCFSDELAIGAYRALLDHNLSIPTDCAIVGVDGIEETEYFEVPISTVVQPIESMCLLAWDFLRNRLNDPKLPHQQITLPSHLVVRQSSSS
jgi:DNA-binding LacI/PurR family transcriptional regulator